MYEVVIRINEFELYGEPDDRARDRTSAKRVDLSDYNPRSEYF